MKIHEARELAERHGQTLIRLLEGIFGDPQTAVKFCRYTLQRLEVEADELEADATSAVPLLRLGRETCSEYLSKATYEKTLFVEGDRALPLNCIPDSLIEADPTTLTRDQRVRTLLSVLPAQAKLVLRLHILEKIGLSDLELLFSIKPGHLAAFLDRVQNALGSQEKVAGIGPDLEMGVSSVQFELTPTLQGAATQRAGGVEVTDAIRRPTSGTRNSPVLTPTRNVPALAPGRKTTPGSGPVVGYAVAVSYRERPSGAPAAAQAPERGLGRHLWVVAVIAVLVLVESTLVGGGRPVVSAAIPATSLLHGRPAAHKPADAYGRLELPTGSGGYLHPKQVVKSPLRGEARLILDSGVQIWMVPGSAGRIDREEFELESGVARISVTAGAAGFVAVADPIRMKLAAGEYVLRKGEKISTAIACLSGMATDCGSSSKGMTVEAGRSLTVGADRVAEVRDTKDRLDVGWGSEAAVVAHGAAARDSFSSGSNGGSAVNEGGAGGQAASAPGERQLYSADTVANASGSGVRTGSGGFQTSGVDGYRQAF